MAISNLKGSSLLSPRYCRSHNNCGRGVPSLISLLRGEAAGGGQTTEDLKGRDRAVNKTVRERVATRRGQVRAASKAEQDQAANKVVPAGADRKVAQYGAAKRRLDNYSVKLHACHIPRPCRRLRAKAYLVQPISPLGQSSIMTIRIVDVN